MKPWFLPLQFAWPEAPDGAVAMQEDVGAQYAAGALEVGQRLPLLGGHSPQCLVDGIRLEQGFRELVGQLLPAYPAYFHASEPGDGP